MTTIRVTADTNVLVRAVVADDPEQAAEAARLLREADLIAVPAVALCELVRVLISVYGFNAADAASAVRALTAASTLRCDRSAADAGLATLDAGGDFADGVIAFEGARLGADVFATFDRKAARLLDGVPPASLVG
ncbi:MAG: type II toxin-antitoxin system VapC family toxin [Bifidobacteriaceae bacterium]|jgi:predicted nucleic-acid-binding protein|nr:type II toxin-antitoxin system VapC family toxin [Bifidobacteriaceae bacterium]